MTAFAMDILLRSNEDWIDSVALWLTDTGGEISGEPFPIDETWQIVQHLRSPNEELIPSFVLSNANGRLMIVNDYVSTGGDIAETRIQWNVTREAVQYIPAGVYFHDVKLIDPDGGEIILFAGTVTMVTGTTRP